MACRVAFYGGTGLDIELRAPASVATRRTWTLPQDDPATAADKFLTTDDAGVLSFAIPNVVDDTTPQLGGILDVNGNAVASGTGGGSHAYLSLVEGNDSLLVADGGVGEAAKNMHVRGGQSDTSSGGRVYITGGSGLIGGNVQISGGSGSGSGPYGGDILITPGISENDDGGSLHLSAPVGSTSSPILSLSEAHANGSEDIHLRAPVSVATGRTWTLPQDDPAVADGKFLTTDNAGVLSFATVPAVWG